MPIFNEEKLREEIIKIWGEHGAHCEIFDDMLKKIHPILEIGNTVFIKRYKTVETITGIHGDGKNKVYFVDSYYDGFYANELQKL